MQDDAIALAQMLCDMLSARFDESYYSILAQVAARGWGVSSQVAFALFI